MSGEALYLAGAIAVCAAVTCAIRALPFLIFGRRALPETVKFLGEHLPPAIMVILVCYCLRAIDFSAYPFGGAEILACLSIVLIHSWRKNLYLSIFTGTAVYMVLLHTVFPG